ncbi:elongation factor Ts [Spirochaetia bacterium]|nr:elongation factor Ts [Spirochaetia bacterium]GHU35108.1 elongation factor Ts [Spirochaetia bacterium]
MAVSASDVKALREKTGAGMMECKNALVSTDGDMAAAEKLLKEKGLAALEKRSGRATNEGKIFVKSAGNKAVLVELASETDFVARNPEFIALGESIADRTLEKGCSESLQTELNALTADLATKIRENMSLKRLQVVEAAGNELLTQYIHGDGAIGVVVKIAAENPTVLQNESIKELAFNLALHVAAFNPVVLEQSRVDPAFLKEQEEIFRKQMETDTSLAGKPANVLENILKGKVSKYLKDICFLDQPYVKDEKFTVAQILAECSKQIGTQIRISDYVYFKVGA